MEPSDKFASTHSPQQVGHVIGRVDIVERVDRWGLREDVVEKDYVLGWVLWGIGNDPQLRENWVFKGGTCLKKCFIETYRFSEDLDFTVLENGPIDSDEVLEALTRVLDRVGQESGINFAARQAVCRVRRPGISSEGRIYYIGPRNTPGPARIKLDLTNDEEVVRPPVLRPISHDYPDTLPAPGQVRCYSFEEVFAEKIRAMAERSRPRDLYDIVNLFRRPDFRQHGSIVREVLEQKCEAKAIPFPSAQSIHSSPMFSELEREWGNMLAHQLRALPDFLQFWDEVPNIFAWLEGTEIDEHLEPVPLGEGDEIWIPPQTFWTEGAGSRLEPVRYAAVNHLLVDLGYGDRRRLVEPYSLRRTRAGNILLHTRRANGAGHRAYRIDRIQSVLVTAQPFTPRFRIEFPAEGVLPAPPSRHGNSSSSRRTRQPSRREYRVRCPARRKLFRRVNRNTRLRPHKDPSGTWNCYARTGHFE